MTLVNVDYKPALTNSLLIITQVGMIEFGSIGYQPSRRELLKAYLLHPSRPTYRILVYGVGRDTMEYHYSWLVFRGQIDIFVMVYYREIFQQKIYPSLLYTAGIVQHELD